MTEENGNTEPDWKQLEHLVAEIQKQLSPDAVVSHNVKLPGIQSETERQVDVLVEQNIGQYTMRIVIDCKDYAKPVDVKGVEEFYGLVQDVGAHKGALVCPKGFSKAAKNRAKKLEIELYSPVDTDPHKWTAKVAAPVLCDVRTTYMSFGISVSVPKPFTMKMDFYNSSVFDSNKVQLGTIVELAQKNWDHGKYPTEPGTHENLPIVFDDNTLMDNGYGELVEVTLKVGLRIDRKFFYGHLPIEKIRGLKDEQTGAVVTNAFTTGTLDFETVQKKWEEVEEGQDLPMKPLFVVVGLDCYGYGT